METFTPLFICFGIPLIGVVVYAKLFAGVPDNTIFKIGLVNTINYLGWFSVFSTVYLLGLSGMAILGFSYLICIAPILSIGFSYWILLHKSELTNYRYALFTSISYIVLILCFTVLIYFKPFD
ncbi:MAG: hypothetical protein JWN60_25 [Acidobacteria bacterium]|jgi:hypothetical protein|nr:hypothetical protein [Acidobacteriota bacterium]